MYYANAVKSYGIEHGMPSSCVQYSFITTDGRLELIPCPYVQNAQGINLYHLDGYNSYLEDIEFPTDATEHTLIPCGTTDEGVVYGYLLASQVDSSYPSWFFTHHLGTDTWQFFAAPELSNRNITIWGATYANEAFYILCQGSSGLYSFSLEDSEWNLIAETQIEEVSSLNNIQIHLWLKTPRAFYVEKDSIWMENRMGDIIQITTTDGNTNIYKSDKKSLLTQEANSIHRLPTGEIIYAKQRSGRLFVLNKRNIEFEHWNRPDVRTYLSSDNQGNYVIYTSDSSTVQTAILVNQRGQTADYSPVMRDLFRHMKHDAKRSRLYSEDFTRSAVLQGWDFLMADVTSRPGVKSYEVGATRGVVELDNGDWVIGKRKIFRNGKLTFSQQNAYDCYDAYSPTTEVINLDFKGSVHGTRFQGVRHNDYLTQNCTTYLDSQSISRITRAGHKQIYALGSSALFSVDLDNQSVDTLIRFEIDLPLVNSLFVTREGDVYLGTTQGLYKADLDKGSITSIDLKADIQINCLYEDAAGRLWIGTHYDGIKIYQPGVGFVDSINTDDGLSNNIVASFIEDEDGDVWVGTFHGITILNQQIELVGYLYEQGGLINNECNRWGANRLSDNRLFFGTSAGFSIIDPTIVKREILLKEQPLIFLSEVSSDTETFKYGSPNFQGKLSQGISIPASNRSIQIKYGLSQYASPETNTFAYRYDLPGNEWKYIGELHQLHLNDLPPGKYNIQLKSTTYAGVVSSNILSIPVRVDQYFYKQLWFYILCALPFIGFGALWIRRQKGERKRLELEVFRRTEKIQEQADQLRVLDQAKNRLFTNITHEFRTPITVIRGLADRVMTDNKAPELIKRNADNLLSLVNQMLDLRRIESGNMTLDNIQGDIIRYLRYLSEPFVSLAKQRGQQLHFLADDEEFMMDFDPDKINRVISNLLSNAIKFTPEGGQIYLNINAGSESTSGSELVIKVIDTGKGIPSDQLDKIFNRFYQVDDSSTRRHEGTGIGLTLVSEMVQLMGGQVHVKSRPGQGSTFSLVLPVTNEFHIEEGVHHPKSLLQEASLLEAHDDVTIENGLRENSNPEVLIVEDNADVIHYLTSILKKNYRLRIAMNGAEGVEKAIDIVPDLIVSDVMMPGLNGFELCAKLKRHEITSHIPIILLTAKADAESRLTGLERGADAYLEKPFDSEELLIRIRQLLELRKTLRARYADMTFHAPSQDVSVAAEDVFVQKFKEILIENLDDAEFGINEMHRALHVSRTQLHNKISALTGKSTSLFMRQIRLHEARQLLGKAEYNISDIAYAVGFKDPKYFTRVFKLEFGYAPSEHQSSEGSV